MNTRELAPALVMVCSEIVDGASSSGGYLLNPGDIGLLRSLDRLSAEEASAAEPGRTSVAAHGEHLRYGLSLLNRWAAGENPFADANWSASWQRQHVTDAEWARLREDLRDEAHRWQAALSADREVNEIELNGMVGSIAHLAYHLGAVRQLCPTLRGPAAND